MQTNTKSTGTLTDQIRNIKIGETSDFPLRKRNTVLGIRDRLGFEGYKFRTESLKNQGVIRVYKISNPESES